MSQIKNLFIEKKEEIEMDKMETGTNIDKSSLSGIITKSKISKKEEKVNKSFHEKHLPEKEIDNKSNISMVESSKTPRDNKLKKYNSDNISGYFTFNNNRIKPFQTNSYQKRRDDKKTRTNKIINNNIIKRVREFVPAKEYLSLLDEIDEDEDIIIETKNSVYKNDSKINKDNNNSENRNLKDIENKKKSEELKVVDEVKETKIITERLSDEYSRINKKVFDIYNIDINLDFADKKGKKEKMRDLLNYKNFNNESNVNKINSYRFLEIMKENREKKFKKEFHDNFLTYSTTIFFKYGEYTSNINNYKECIIILRKPFLYVLNQNNSPITEETIKFLNPDISLINTIENNNKKTNKYNFMLKNKYNLSSPLLTLNFNLLSCILLINKNNINEFQIMILGWKNKFSFIINDTILFKKYVFLIHNLIKNTDGSHRNLLGLSLRNNIFYKEIYITLYEFEKEAKTGDLLLFKTMDSYANCQRFFTCDEYDHVGIILYKNKKIYIFESTSLGKCTPLSWNSFKQLFFNLVYYKIAYRKLNYENNDIEKQLEIQTKLEDNCIFFTDDLKGKDYYLSLSKILCCKSPDSYEYENNFYKAKGFCCSSLVAAIYLKLGVVKLVKSVHSTRPGDFEQNNNRLTFSEGFSLGPEKIIDFSQ